MSGVFSFHCLSLPIIGLGVAIPCHAEVWPPLPSENQTRDARFANPPGSCRLLPIRHSYPLTETGQDDQLSRLAGRGFGGFAGNASLERMKHGALAGYVDDETVWPAFVYSLSAAARARMSVWLYDEAGYPSGSGRDLVLKAHPELEGTGYLVATASVKGGQTAEMRMPPGRFRIALACPLDAHGLLVGGFRDISESVRNGRKASPPDEFSSAVVTPEDAAERPRDGFDNWRRDPWIESFAWTAPATGDWLVCAVTENWIYEGTHAECKGMALKFRYPNPLVAAATDRFLTVNHEAYVRHLGNNLGKWFVSTFADEPSLMANCWRDMPYLMLPSCPGFAESYLKRSGRGLLQDIPYLVADAVDDGAALPRVAFWGLAAELLSDNFFGRISDWCRSHGFLSGGHLMGEENFCFHVSHYGDFFRVLRRLDAPSIDCLTSDPHDSWLPVPWLAALFAGSARELNGGKYAMCEVSNHVQNGRKPRQVCSEAMIRGTLNLLTWGGINTFTSYYSVDDKPDVEMRRINTQLGRINTMLLRDGFSAADIALLYPAEDAMAVYRPTANVWHEKSDGSLPVNALERRFTAVASSLFDDGRCFMIVDAPSIMDARVEGDSLVHGKLRWKVVVVVGCRHPHEVEKRLREFRTSGGVVIRPPVGRERDVAAAVAEVLEPHVRIPRFGGEAPLRIAHRRTADGDVFLIVNDSERDWRGAVGFCGGATGLEYWDPVDGTHGPAQRTRNGSGSVRVELQSYGAGLFTSATRREPVRHRRGDDASAAVEKLRVIGVQADGRNLERNLEKVADGEWRSTGRVVEGGQDTYNFIGFRVDGLPRKTEKLIVDVNVLHDSAVAPKLGVFIETEFGSFFAPTEVLLGSKGSRRVEIPLSKFRGHRISGAFLPEDVCCVRIGYGGYRGKSGDEVSFSVRTPMCR